MTEIDRGGLSTTFTLHSLHFLINRRSQRGQGEKDRVQKCCRKGLERQGTAMLLGEGAWRETGYKSPGGGAAWKSIQFPDFPPTHQLIGGVTLQLEQALKPLAPMSAIGKNSLKDKGNFFICSQNNFIACSSFCYARKSFFASTCTFEHF